MKKLLKKVLDNYFTEYERQFGNLPETVKTEDIFVPEIHSQLGEWGTWKPEPPHNIVPIEIFSEFYGEPFPEELYEFITCWRFAPFDFTNEGMVYTINAVYEDKMHRPNVLMSVALDNTLYYLIGTAFSPETEISYGIFLKSTGGIYMIEDGTDKPQFLDESIRKFLVRGIK